MVEALKPVAAKWYSIGLQLKLGSDQLHTVESELRASPTSFEHGKLLEDMLKLRLENGGKPSWREVANALYQISESDVADQLVKKHSEFIGTASSVLCMALTLT